MLAPVALFVYNRPEHTLRTLDALANNDLAKQTILFIFSDGPKINPSPEELQRIDEVRIHIRKENRFKDVKVFEAKINKGLADSIIAGVTKTVNEFGKIIVLEDDILTSKYFLRFCNEGLDKYQSINKVKVISGFMFPVDNITPNTFFMKTVACWGWATWKDRWEIFNPDAAYLLNEIKRLGRKREFNANNSYYHFELLQDQLAGKVNSWAVRWYASIFLNRGITLYPARSLTQNIGMDGTGTHYTGIADEKTGGNNVLQSSNYDLSQVFDFTDSYETDKKIENLFQKYLKLNYPYGVIFNLKNRLKKILRKIIALFN
jgi:hypothetical protein